MSRLAGTTGVRSHITNTATVIYDETEHTRLETGATGWAILQGVAVDVTAANPRPQLTGLWDQDPPDLDVLEGSYALALWDEQRTTGWFRNDHSASRNLYYLEHQGRVYVATAPVALAQALGLGLSSYGVQQMLVRGCVLAPTTLFGGMFRMDVGQVGKVSDGRLEMTRPWTPVVEPTTRRLTASAEAIADTVIDRVGRIEAVSTASIADLSGGLDSRVVNLARQAAGARVDVTVNGPDSDSDVIVAHEVAEEMDWTIRHYELHTPVIGPDLREEMTLRTAGELPFNMITFHHMTRPELANTYDLHMVGSGGELMRFYAWSHEFLNIGRRRQADADRTVRYRYSQYGPPPQSILRSDWFPEFQQRLIHEIRRRFELMPGTLTTQQQDALYVWKMTSHSSQWISSTSGWLTSCAPLLMRGCVDSMVSVPWRLRLSSRLQRRVNQLLSPEGAAIRTVYGGPAGKATMRDLPAVALQTGRAGIKLAAKVRRVLKKSDRMPGVFVPNYLTDEFRNFLRPEHLVTAHYYDKEGLRRYLSGTDADLAARGTYLTRIATIEHLARALV